MTDLDDLAAQALEQARRNPGPQAQLLAELAAAVAAQQKQTDRLYRLIAALASGSADTAVLDVPAELTEAMHGPPGAITDVVLRIDGRDWIAAVTPTDDGESADVAGAWAAITRLAGDATDPE